MPFIKKSVQDALDNLGIQVVDELPAQRRNTQGRPFSAFYMAVKDVLDGMPLNTWVKVKTYKADGTAYTVARAIKKGENKLFDHGKYEAAGRKNEDGTSSLYMRRVA